jgi:hypothetical protein
MHVFVPIGVAALDRAGALTTGDAVRLTGEAQLTLIAGDGGAEILVWATA